MVSSIRTATRLMIIARPNQSAAWSANMLLLLALSILVLTIAIAFALLGAWLILPFAGVEILALGAALYHVNWKQQYRHVITVSKDRVRIDKGHYRSRQHWQFPRQCTGLTITSERHSWDSPALCVHDRNEIVPLGEFLNREDSLLLISLLQDEFHIRTHAVQIECEF